jgi:aquaporin Z
VKSLNRVSVSELRALSARAPLGRLSGAHLNPAVTLGRWLQRVVGRADLAGYLLAQVAGGVVRFAAGALWGSRVGQPPVSWAIIAPSINQALSALIEAAATAAQLGLVFWLLLDERRTRWTAPVAGTSLAIAIIAVATTSGAGFNPVRGFAPDLVAGTYPGLWTFLIGPLAGTALAGGAFRIFTSQRPLTGKLRHDADAPCYLACALPRHLPSTRADSELQAAGTP